MKRKIVLAILTALASLCLCLTFAACGSNGGNGDNGGDGENGGNDGETHEWSAWEVTKEATCSEEGTRSRTCSDCGKVETETIPAKDHTFNDNNVCSVCGFELVPTVGLEYELYEATDYPREEYYRVKGMGTATDKDLVIPASHAGKKVKQIGAEAFNGKDFLTSVYIPNGVESVGMNAFSYCISLSSLRLPNTVKSIGIQAFYGCNKMKDITLGTSGIRIGESAFGNTAYYQNSKNWEKGALYIGEHLIATNNDLPSSYTVKDGSLSIAAKAFSGRSELEEIVIPWISASGEGSDIFANCGVSKATANYDNLDLLPADQIIDLTVSGGTIYKSKSTNDLFRKFLNLENLFVDTDWEDRKGTYGNEQAPLAGLGKLKNLKVKWLGGSFDSYSMHTLFGDESYSGSVEIKVEIKQVVNITAYLPASLETVAVESGKIPGGAFSNCTMISNITIGSGVTSIGDFTFYGCSGLTSITIPDSVTSIGEEAFVECSGLKSITIPDSVTSIGYNAFYGCSGLTGVYINDLAAWCKIEFGGFTTSNPLYLAHNLYLGEEKISELVVPDEITELKPLAFTGGAFTSLKLHDKVTSIGSSAFRDCSGLTSVTIGKGVTSIGSSAFYGCSGLTSIEIPDSVTSIGGGAFYGCRGLKSITIPDSVTSIEREAFYNCSGLTSITIPDSVTSIGDMAFYNCSGLTSITIPDSVTSIGSSAFYGTAYYNDESHWDSNGVLYIGNHLIKAQDTISGAYTIRTGTKTIADYAFKYCSKLTSVTIGSGLTSIGSYAFEECRGLTSVTIGKGVTSIGNHTFYGCSGLTSISIPDSVTSIGDYAFRDCSGLTSISIPDSVTSIGDYAFRDCSGLTGTLTIPDSVTSIGEDAFYGCNGLTGTLTIPDSVTSIGDEAFVGCSGLTSIEIPDSVTSIGYSTFYGCSGLTDIHFNGTYDRWTEIGGNSSGISTEVIIHCTDGDFDRTGKQIKETKDGN